MRMDQFMLAINDAVRLILREAFDVILRDVVMPHLFEVITFHGSGRFVQFE